VCVTAHCLSLPPSLSPTLLLPLSPSPSLPLSQDADKRKTAKAAIEELAKQIKFEVVGWRVVPVKPAVLGKLALENSPWVEQLVLKSTQGQKRPSMCQRRPSMCQKRPSMCQKRPSMCQRRPGMCQKRPSLLRKSTQGLTGYVSKET